MVHKLMKPMIELDFESEVILDLIYAKLKTLITDENCSAGNIYYFSVNFLFNIIVLQQNETLSKYYHPMMQIIVQHLDL